jgi:hypothetical protein
VRRTALSRVSDAIACDAFWSPDDDLCHAVVLARDGTITDVVYDDGRVRAAGRVGVVDGARDLTAFWSDADDERNVTLVTASGRVPHFRQKGSAAWATIQRRDVPDAIRIAGYDQHHHGIVLTAAGRITDEPFHGVSAAVRQAFVEETTTALANRGRVDAAAAVAAPSKEEPSIEVATVAGAVDIAALWADAQNRFVIAAGGDGALIEFGYGAHQEETRRLLGTIPGAFRLNGCYVGEPATGRRIVALARGGEVHVLRFGAAVPAADPPIARVAAQDVACFAKRDNVMRIVVLAGDELVEIVPDEPSPRAP